MRSFTDIGSRGLDDQGGSGPLGPSSFVLAPVVPRTISGQGARPGSYLILARSRLVLAWLRQAPEHKLGALRAGDAVVLSDREERYALNLEEARLLFVLAHLGRMMVGREQIRTSPAGSPASSASRSNTSGPPIGVRSVK
jgi:hypothetical protein